MFPDHTGVYPVDWLIQHCYTGDMRDRHKEATPLVAVSTLHQIYTASGPYTLVDIFLIVNTISAYYLFYYSSVYTYTCTSVMCVYWLISVNYIVYNHQQLCYV